MYTIVITAMDQISGQFITSGAIIGVALIYWLFVLITLYHLDRFGTGTQPRRIAIIYFIGSFGLFFVTGAALYYSGPDFIESIRLLLEEQRLQF